MSFKPKKHVMLSKMESVYRTDPVPTGAANAILIANPKLTPLIQSTVDRAVLKPYLGNHGKVIAGGHVGLDYDVEMAGAGSAGSAPGYGPLLKGCAMAEKINAADVTGTAQAGAAGTITLAAAASAVDDAYQYFRISIDGGTGAGQSGVIRSYNGTTKVATMYEDWSTAPDVTSTYTIHAQVAYTTVSAGEQSRASYFNIDGLQHTMLGVLSDMSLKLPKSAIPMFSFKDIGIYATPTDTSMPAATLTGFQYPKAVNQANTTGTLHGYAAIFSDISLQLGNVISYSNMMNSEKISFTGRKPAGSVTFEHPTISAKDFYSIAEAATPGALNVVHGTAAGHRVGVYCPAVQLTNPTDQNDVHRMLGMSLDVQPVDGNDEMILTVY